MAVDSFRYLSLCITRLHAQTNEVFSFLTVVVLIFLTSCSGTSTRVSTEPDMNAVAAETNTTTEPVAPSAIPGADENAGFSIYVVQEELPVSEIAKADLNSLLLEDYSILSIDDIVEYKWESHEISLTPSAYTRLAGLQRQILSNPGLPFAVCVGSERIYRGAFWSSHSSVPFDGIVIDIYPAGSSQPVRIETGYPTTEWFTGEDLRDDLRIFKSLEAANKLT